MTATIHDLNAYREKKEKQRKAMKDIAFMARYSSPNAFAKAGVFSKYVYTVSPIVVPKHTYFEKGEQDE